MPIISITQFMDKLYEYMTEYFHNYRGLAAKCNNAPSGGEFSNVPTIYKYLMPSGELSEGYPTKSPCIVITVDNQEDTRTYALTAHVCVKYDAVAESEMARPIAGAEGRYEFIESTEYHPEADIELYKTCLLFTELVASVLYQNKHLNITDITSMMPDATLPDYPYCISAVSFKTQINTGEVNVKAAYDDLY